MNYGMSKIIGKWLRKLKHLLIERWIQAALNRTMIGKMPRIWRFGKTTYPCLSWKTINCQNNVVMYKRLC